jgi:hypothetical protein
LAEKIRPKRVRTVALPLADRAGTIARPPRQRSRASNGSTLFADGGDMRTPWARRLRDIWEAHVADLGGIDATSEAECSIARRAAVLTVELEKMEAVFAVVNATPEQLDLYQRTANSLRRMLETLGLKRRARDVTLDLQGYLAGKANPEPPAGPR